MRIRLNLTLGLLAALALAPWTTMVSAEDAVISLDYRSDRLKRISDEPTLSIYQDGRVVMPQTYTHSQAHDAQLDHADVQALISFAHESGFFDYGNAKRTVADSEARGIRFSHSTETVMLVRDGDRVQRLAIQDLQHTAGAQGLRAFRERLEQVMTVIKLGGKDEAQHWLDRANAELLAVHSDVEPLDLMDLRSGGIRNDGSLSVLFERDADDTAGPTRVSISMNADGESAAAVFPQSE